MPRTATAVRKPLKTVLPLTIARANLPRLGAALAGGKFAGIVIGETDGDPDIALVDVELSTKDMNWKAAGTFAAARDAVLPNRAEARVLWANLDSRSKESHGWYWLRTQYAGYESYAWFQDFSTGFQTSGHEDYGLRARAVRRLVIQ